MRSYARRHKKIQLDHKWHTQYHKSTSVRRSTTSTPWDLCLKTISKVKSQASNPLANTLNKSNLRKESRTIARMQRNSAQQTRKATRQQNSNQIIFRTRNWCRSKLQWRQSSQESKKRAQRTAAKRKLTSNHRAACTAKENLRLSTSHQWSDVIH